MAFDALQAEGDALKRLQAETAELDALLNKAFKSELLRLIHRSCDFFAKVGMRATLRPRKVSQDKTAANFSR